MSCHFKTCSFCLSNLKTQGYFCLGYASRVVPPGGNLGWKMRSIFQSEWACRLNWKRWQAWIWNGISYQTFRLLLKIGNIPLKLKSDVLTSACEVHISAPLALSQNGLASWNMSVQCEIRHLLSVQLRSWAQRSAQPFLCHQGSTRQTRDVTCFVGVCNSRATSQLDSNDAIFKTAWGKSLNFRIYSLISRAKWIWVDCDEGLWLNCNCLGAKGND